MDGLDIGTLVGGIELEDRLSPTLNTALGNLSSASTRVSQFGGLVAGAGLAMAPLAAGITGVGVASVRMATELNEGIANVSALLTDVSGPQLTQVTDEMKAKVRSMAVDMGKSTADISGGLYEVVSSLGYTNDTFGQLEISAKAGAAGLASTQDAFNFLSSVTKTYGDTSEDAFKKVANLGFQAVNIGQTTFPQLAASIGSVAPLAKVAGVNLEELFAVISTATGVTGNTAEVTTQMASALNALMNPSAAMKDLFMELGVATGQALIQERGFVGALQEVSNYAERTGRPMLDLLGRKEAFILTASLAGSQAGKFGRDLDLMGQAAQKNATIVEDAFGKQTQGVNAAGFAWEQFKIEVQVAGQELGDALLPILVRAGNIIRPVISAVLDLARAFGELPEPVQTGIVAVSMGFVGLTSAMVTVGGGIKALQWAFSGLGVDLVASAGKWLGFGKNATLAKEAVDVAQKSLVATRGTTVAFDASMLGASTTAKTLSTSVVDASKSIAGSGLAVEKAAGSVSLWSRGLSLLSNPLTAAIGLIVTITAAVYKLSGSWETTFGLLAPPIGAAIGLWKRLEETISPHKKLLDDIGRIVKAGVVIAWNEAKQAVSDAIAPFITIGRHIVDLASKISTQAKPMLADLVEQFKNALPLSVRVAIAGLEWAKTKIDELGGSFEGFKVGVGLTADVMERTANSYETAGKKIESSGLRVRAGFVSALAVAPMVASGAANVAATTGQALTEAVRYAQRLDDAYKNLSDTVKNDLRVAVRAGVTDIEKLKALAPGLPEETIKRYVATLEDAANKSKQAASEARSLYEALAGVDATKRLSVLASAWRAVPPSIKENTTVQRQLVEQYDQLIPQLVTVPRHLQSSVASFNAIAVATGKFNYELQNLQDGLPSLEGIGTAVKAGVHEGLIELERFETELANLGRRTGVAFPALDFEIGIEVAGEEEFIDTVLDITERSEEIRKTGLDREYAEFERAKQKELQSLANLVGRGSAEYARLSGEVEKYYDKLRDDAAHEAFIANLDKIASGFADLAQIAGEGGMSTVFRTLGTLASSASLAGDSIKSIKTGWTAVTQGGGGMSLFSGLASLASGWVGVASAAIQAGKAMWDAFTKGDWERAADEIKRTWEGVGSIGEEVAKKIEEDMKTRFEGMKNNRWLAEVFNLDAIIEDIGGVTEKNIAGLMEQLHNAFSFLETGAFETADVTKILQGTFDDFAEFYTDRNALISSSLQEIIVLDRRMGVESAAVTEFLSEQADRAASGFDKIAGNFLTLVTGFKSGSEDMKAVMEEISESIEKGVVGDFAPEFVDDVIKQLDRIGPLAEAAFGSLVAGGASFTEAMMQLSPSLQDIRDTLAATGVQATGFLGEMLGWSQVVDQNKELFEVLSGVDDMLVGLHNGVALSQEAFSSLVGTLAQAKDSLLAQGVAADDVYGMMQGQLQKVWELVQDQRYAVDEATAAMLREAEAQGVVGDAHRSVQSQMLQAQQDMRDVLIGIGEVFGVHLPQQVDTFATAVEGAAGRVTGAAPAMGEAWVGAARTSQIAAEELGNSWAGSAGTAADAWSGAANQIVNAGGEIAAQDPFSNWIEHERSAGEQIIHNMQDRREQIAAGWAETGQLIGVSWGTSVGSMIAATDLIYDKTVQTREDVAAVLRELGTEGADIWFAMTGKIRDANGEIVDTTGWTVEQIQAHLETIYGAHEATAVGFADVWANASGQVVDTTGWTQEQVVQYFEAMRSAIADVSGSSEVEWSDAMQIIADRTGWTRDEVLTYFEMIQNKASDTGGVIADTWTGTIDNMLHDDERLRSDWADVARGNVDMTGWTYEQMQAYWDQILASHGAMTSGVIGAWGTAVGTMIGQNGELLEDWQSKLGPYRDDWVQTGSEITKSWDGTTGTVVDMTGWTRDQIIDYLGQIDARVDTLGGDIVGTWKGTTGDMVDMTGWTHDQVVDYFTKMKQGAIDAGAGAIDAFTTAGGEIVDMTGWTKDQVVNYLTQIQEAAENSASGTAEAFEGAGIDAGRAMGVFHTDMKDLFFDVAQVSEEAAYQARQALISIGKNIPDIEIGYRFEQEGPGLPSSERVEPLRFAAGGFVPRGSDTIPAMLQPAEFVLNPAATEAIGPERLALINTNPQLFGSLSAPRESETNVVVRNEFVIQAWDGADVSRVLESRQVQDSIADKTLDAIERGGGRITRLRTLSGGRS